MSNSSAQLQFTMFLNILPSNFSSALILIKSYYEELENIKCNERDKEYNELLNSLKKLYEPKILNALNEKYEGDFKVKSKKSNDVDELEEKFGKWESSFSSDEDANSDGVTLSEDNPNNK